MLADIVHPLEIDGVFEIPGLPCEHGHAPMLTT